MFCNFLERMLTVQENKLKTQCYVYKNMKKLHSKVLNKFSLLSWLTQRPQKSNGLFAIVAYRANAYKTGPLPRFASPASRQAAATELID